MSVTAPPRPPRPDRSRSEPLDRKEIEALVEALIEEARRETRRRRRKYWAVAALVTFVGVVVLILLDGGAASQTAAPAVSAQSNAASRTGPSRIAFLRGYLGPSCRPAGRCNDELYLINADGTGLRRLTQKNTALGYDPVAVWSPDGRKLVFVKRPERSGAPCRPTGRCHEEIYVVNADGTGLRRLTRNAVFDGKPVWSPDGRSIAFTRDRDRQTVSIYVMNADGSDQRRLTLLPPRAGGDGLTWSPDWKKIAFVAPAGHRGAADIFVMNPDGSDLRNVTNTATTSFDFAWSPDGRRIAYLEGSPSPAGGPPPVGRPGEVEARRRGVRHVPQVAAVGVHHEDVRGSMVTGWCDEHDLFPVGRPGQPVPAARGGSGVSLAGRCRRRSSHRCSLSAGRGRA